MPEQEARSHQRVPAYLGAKIFFDHNPSTFDCLVKNISDSGAQINIETTWNLPETFRLHIAKHDISYRCHTRWKSLNKIGVSYTGSI